MSLEAYTFVASQLARPLAYKATCTVCVHSVGSLSPVSGLGVSANNMGWRVYARYIHKAVYVLQRLVVKCLSVECSEECCGGQV